MTDTFAVIVRMMWIDDTIDNEGQINRADIARAFAVSTQQASLDLKRYMAAHPGRIAYDVRAKCYVQVEGSKTLFWGSARAAASEIVRQAAEVIAPPKCQRSSHD
jgi:hypothetical protein